MMIDQKHIIDFLAHPESYGGDKVERKETHISAIFLVGSKVYKLKKAIALPFLDFSELSMREKACRAEYHLNKRTAPDIYQSVVPIVIDKKGNLKIIEEIPDDNDSEVVDWLVVMNRFDESSLFDHLAETKILTDLHIRQVADEVAHLHQQAEKSYEWGGYEGIKQTILGNKTCFDRYTDSIFTAEESQILTDRSLSAMESLKDQLENRRLNGYVRQCHGDLHLGNICLYQNRPTLFDAIEFNEAFSKIDCFYDVAFLLMDLKARQMPRLANIFLNRYLERLSDSAALPLLPLFISIRAAIRSHVSAAMGKAELARTYYQQALEALDPREVSLIACGGFSGSGKSRLARELAPLICQAPGAFILRTDVLRKRIAGVAFEEKLGDEFYSQKITDEVYDLFFSEAELALKNGHSVILDAVFAKEEQRKRAESLAKHYGLPFYGFWLQAESKTLKERVVTRQKEASDATPDIVDRQYRYDLGIMDWNRIDSSGSKDETIRQALHFMKRTS
jgi:aminoglycoside phosphotransferase family enzyme/predicted kinase